MSVASNEIGISYARLYRHSKAATPRESPSLKATLSPGMYWTSRLHSLDKASIWLFRIVRMGGKLRLNHEHGVEVENRSGNPAAANVSNLYPSGMDFHGHSDDRTFAE